MDGICVASKLAETVESLLNNIVPPTLLVASQWHLWVFLDIHYNNSNQPQWSLVSSLCYFVSIQVFQFEEKPVWNDMPGFVTIVLKQ